MASAKYSVNQHPIQILLSWVKSGEIAIPEIQRPFVWKATQVRKLIDSLYQGFPVGYLIAWRNPEVKLKDGSKSAGKRIIIDGQQRMTALMAAILGMPVIDNEYKKVRIKIAFQPIEEKFEVANPAIEKDKTWFSDIAEVMNEGNSLFGLVARYRTDNPEYSEEQIFKPLERLRSLVNNQIGLIELNSELDIEAVTEIFVRINSSGKELKEADFVMSKLGANETYNGNELRKMIDYFCHLCVAPHFHDFIREHDVEFQKTDLFSKISWLGNVSEDLYDPNFTDLIRVAFTSKFKRGRLRDLVALLSGRNFETREFEDEVAQQSFATLREGVLNFVSQTNFERFMMILRSAGFIDPSLIGAKNAVNFAYIVYLILREEGFPPAQIESFTRKWYVLSILTERYAGNPEGTFDFDIRRINEHGFINYFEYIESATFSDVFWEVGLPQKFETPSTGSPFYRLFLAAQVKSNDKGFLSHAITVQDLILHRGDVHHIFPKNYLKKHGKERSQYNQIANFVLMQSEININIGDQSPAKYFPDIFKQCQTKIPKYGGITDEQHLVQNFEMNCIPIDLNNLEVSEYDEFLKRRRLLMASKIKRYYSSL